MNICIARFQQDNKPEERQKYFNNRAGLLTIFQQKLKRYEGMILYFFEWDDAELP